MKLGVIGGGVVGQATARAFIEHVDEVRVYDVVPERRTHHLDEVVEQSDLIFVCLPTPQKAGSLKCDTSALDDVFSAYALPDAHRGKNFVLRSTVPIGTTRRLREQYGLTNLVHSPEFLTARCAMTDVQIPARNVVGYPEYPGPKAWHPVAELYTRRFPGVPIHYMSSDESEAVKLFQNGFFSVKVSYWNEVRALTDKLGLNWDRVMDAILADGRIANAHTKVPGPDGKFGFGGACLEKDLANLIQCLKEAGVEFDVTSAAYNRNKHVDRVKVV